MIVYKITNHINGKLYIGQTTHSIEKRWKGHCRPSNTKSKLGNAIRKYNKDNFKLEILEFCTSTEHLNEREAYWIAFYDSCKTGYNIRSGGKQSPCSEETRKKIGISNKNNKRSPEIVKKLSELGKAYRHTEESKQKMSIGRLGVRSSHTPIVAIDENGLETRFEAVIDAAKALKIGRTSIGNVLTGLTKATHGFKFRYANKEEASIE